MSTLSAEATETHGGRRTLAEGLPHQIAAHIMRVREGYRGYAGGR